MSFENVAKALVGELCFILGQPASSKSLMDLPCHSLAGIASLVTPGTPVSARPYPTSNCRKYLASIRQNVGSLTPIAQTQGIVTSSTLDGDILYSTLIAYHGQGALYTHQLLLDSITFVVQQVQAICMAAQNVFQTRTPTMQGLKELRSQAYECARIIERIKMQHPYSLLEEKGRDHIERYGA